MTNQSRNISKSFHQPFADNAYTVPGISPTMYAYFNCFLSKIIIGGSRLPDALHAERTLIWVLSLLVIEGIGGCRVGHLRALPD